MSESRPWLVNRSCGGEVGEPLDAGPECILREEREREIEEAFRRGYGEHPQEAWFGEVGLAALAALDRAEGGEPL